MQNMEFLDRSLGAVSNDLFALLYHSVVIIHLGLKSSVHQQLTKVMLIYLLVFEVHMTVQMQKTLNRRILFLMIMAKNLLSFRYCHTS